MKWVEILDQMFTKLSKLGGYQHLLPQFFHQQNWVNNSNYFIGLLWVLNELINIKSIEKLLRFIVTTCTQDVVYFST